MSQVREMRFHCANGLRMRLTGSNDYFSLMLFYTYILNQALYTRLACSMWPAKVFRAALHAFWEFSNN